MHFEWMKKLHIKNGHKLLILNEPEGSTLAKELPGEVMLIHEDQGIEKSCDAVLLFAKNVLELEKWAQKAIDVLIYDGLLWIAYPKKSGKIKTDLSRDQGWDVLHERGYVGIALVSMDENWSVMRFRPTERSARKVERSSAEKKEKSIPVKEPGDRTVELPEDLRVALEQNSEAKDFFDSLAYSHKKEYVRWITEAKKAETRESRVQKTIEKLHDKRKNPADKGI